MKKYTLMRKNIAVANLVLDAAIKLSSNVGASKLFPQFLFGRHGRSAIWSQKEN